MKNFYTLLFSSLLAFSTSNILAQSGPCTLYSASNYIDFTSSPTVMINVSVNGISQYTYAWNDGTTVGSSNQKPFYSGWCVTITDIITGCDTIICESCIPTGGVGFCTMIYDPVCGCDGNIYGNDCIAMNNGIFTYTSTLNGSLPCTVPLPSWDCVNGVCIDPNSGNGQYLTLNDCILDSCNITPPVLSWDCTIAGCVNSGTGTGTFASLSDCQSNCIVVTPTWDCDGQGNCSDPGTGNGAFASLSDCQSNCINVSVEEIGLTEFNIFPNPSSNFFNISFFSILKQDLRLRVLNSLAEEILIIELAQFIGEFTRQIDLSNNAKGIYFLELKTNDGIINKKLVKQ